MYLCVIWLPACVCASLCSWAQETGQMTNTPECNPSKADNLCFGSAICSYFLKQDVQHNFIGKCETESEKGKKLPQDDTKVQPVPLVFQTPSVGAQWLSFIVKKWPLHQGRQICSKHPKH